MKAGDLLLIKAELVSIEGNKAKVKVRTPWGAHILVIIASSEVLLDEPGP